MYHSELHIFETKFQGVVTKDSLIQFINETVEQAKQYHCFSLLCDMREARFQLSLLDEHTLHKNMLKLTDLTYDHKLAVIHNYAGDEQVIDYHKEKVSKQRTDFADTVASNWGQKIWEFFGSYQAGIDYLKEKSVAI